MSTKLRLLVSVALAVALLIPMAALAQGRKGVSIANGPFKYDPAEACNITFLGSSGSSAGGFDVNAPGPGSIFPSGGSAATAEIKVFGVTKVGDADGNALAEPIEINLNSPLGASISGAFTLDPSLETFYPGSTVSVDVAVSNPGVSPDDFGDYVVVMKAQAIGSGIGVGSGSRCILKLRAATDVDETAPDVTIDSPLDSSTHILGNIPVSITANDPAPGSGVDSITAEVNSAGNTVSQSISLTTDTPQPAGSDATGTGTFTPTGGAGAAGNSSGAAFTSSSRSGIGSYALTAEATDGAGNTGDATSNFTVKYDMEFTLQAGITTGIPRGDFKFKSRRSNVTSDGAFVYDHTVVVRIVRVSDSAVMDTHTLFSGSGVIEQVVLEGIDTADALYHTTFRRANLTGPPGAADSYKAVVLFEDVDGNLVVQAESNAVTF